MTFITTDQRPNQMPPKKGPALHELFRPRGRPAATHDSPPSPRQRDIFRWLWEQTCANGCQPSVRELMERFGIKSPNGAMCHLHALDRKGWIKLNVQTARSIRFLRCPDGRPFRGFVPRVEVDI
jgi:SOS-response transcriptional repressor LexA